MTVTTGSVTGRVTDSSGGVLPGVTVTATGLDTGYLDFFAFDGRLRV